MHELHQLIDALQPYARSIGTTDVRGTAMWALAGVFAFSGFVKCLQPAKAGQAIANFGIIPEPSRVSGWLLGCFEILLAVGLASEIQAQLLLLATATTLWLFTAVVVRTLLIGKRFACMCFGNASETVSAKTVLRSGVLAVIATAAAASSEVGGPTEFRLLPIHAAVGIGALATGVLLAQLPILSRQYRAVLRVSMPRPQIGVQ
jgi:hypothetical protein